MEKLYGRERKYKNESRKLDLDIIDFKGIIKQSNPILPHPRMHERLFVLYPLHDLIPDWVHPYSKKNIAELISESKGNQIIKSLPIK
jgi:2-amino-4-hydroxy-6-hydroxymethyldihydropteridine diphosphokinase